MDNLTTGMAIITHSLLTTIDEPNTVVLMCNHTYNAVKLAIRHCCALAENKHGISIDIVMVEIPFPILSEDHDAIILSSFERSLRSIPPDKVVKYAFFDHISSVPAIKMPISPIISLLRSHGVQEVSTYIILKYIFVYYFFVNYSDCR